jgi:hypothetical protein
MRARLAFLAFTAALTTAAGPVFACPACGGGTMPRRVLDIYLFITIMLSALPLFFGALIVRYARRGHDD